jgi:uncharacterized protein YndB with AHSA1/START domain
MNMETSDLGTVHEDGERLRLRYERTLAHPVAEVWRMVTEPDGLAAWFPAKVSYDGLAVGAELTFRFTEEDLERADDVGVEDVPMVSHGEITELEPERVFAFSWTAGNLTEKLRFELTPDGEGCRLVFTTIIDRDAFMAPRTATGWHVCLDHFAAVLDDSEPPGEQLQAKLMPTYQAMTDPVTG